MPDQPSDKSAQEKAKDLIDQAFGREKKDDRSFAERIKDQAAAAAEAAQQKAEQKHEQDERQAAVREQQKARAEQEKARAEEQRATQQSQRAGASVQDSIAAAARQAAENAAKARPQSAPSTPDSDAEELARLRSRVSELEQQNPAAAAPAPAPRTYTVKGGDSLSKIAKNFYGDAMQWKRIYEANRDKISNPDLIHPGQVFVIPE